MPCNIKVLETGYCNFPTTVAQNIIIIIQQSNMSDKLILLSVHNNYAPAFPVMPRKTLGGVLKYYGEIRKHLLYKKYFRDPEIWN